MDFCQLQSRLLAGLRDRIRGGEFTERRLAKLSGISQPHLHNILKGVRELTPGMADRLLRALEISVVDFISLSEWEHVQLLRTQRSTHSREIPVLQRRVGPGSGWPIEESRFERISVPEPLLRDLGHTVVVRLSLDPQMTGIFGQADLALLDTDRAGETHPDPDALYLIANGENAVARWLRVTPKRLYLIHDGVRDRPLEWERIEANPHALVQGRLYLIPTVANPWRDIIAVRRPPGSVPTPALRSFAS